jgi:hypothetical protein
MSCLPQNFEERIGLLTFFSSSLTDLQKLEGASPTLIVHRLTHRNRSKEWNAEGLPGRGHFLLARGKEEL